MLIMSKDKVHSNAIPVAIAIARDGIDKSAVKGTALGLGVITVWNLFLYWLTTLFGFNELLHAVALSCWIINLGATVINLVRTYVEVARLVRDPVFKMALALEDMRNALASVAKEDL